MNEQATIGQKPNIEAAATLGGGPLNFVPAYIIVCDLEGGTPVELPLNEDNSLALSTLQIEFTDATGIKYRNPDTGIFRIVVPQNGKLYPPAGGWGNHHFIACQPKSSDEKPWTNESITTVAGVKRARSSDFTGNGGSFGTFATGSAATGYVRGINRGRGMPMTRGTSFMSRGAPATRGTPMNRGGPLGARGGAPVRGTFPARASTAIAKTGPHPPKFDYCASCEVALNSKQQADSHYSGKKHIETVAKGGKSARARGARGGPPRGGTVGDRGRGGGRGGPGLLDGTDFSQDDTPTMDFSRNLSSANSVKLGSSYAGPASGSMF